MRASRPSRDRSIGRMSHGGNSAGFACKPDRRRASGGREPFRRLPQIGAAPFDRGVARRAIRAACARPDRGRSGATPRTRRQRPPLAASVAGLTASEGVASDRELDSEAIERLASNEQALIQGGDDSWLEDAQAQLEAAARAVYRSWMSERAQTYRRLQRLDDLRGPAVTVQAMVFGNGGLCSGAGVAFSRDPSTGRPEPMVDLVLECAGRGRRLRSPNARQRGSDRPRLAGACSRAWPRPEAARAGISRRAGMSSSPSRTANCGSCRRDPPNVRPAQRSE